MLVLHGACDQRVESEVFALADIAARSEGHSNLTNQDRTSIHVLTAKDFYASVLSI